MSDNLYTQILKIRLDNILKLVNKPCAIRIYLIGWLFPELYSILKELTKIAETVEHYEDFH